jgi:hypothetical protein
VVDIDQAIEIMLIVVGQLLANLGEAQGPELLEHVINVQNIVTFGRQSFELFDLLLKPSNGFEVGEAFQDFEGSFQTSDEGVA